MEIVTITVTGDDIYYFINCNIYNVIRINKFKSYIEKYD